VPRCISRRRCTPHSAVTPCARRASSARSAFAPTEMPAPHAVDPGRPRQEAPSAERAERPARHGVRDVGRCGRNRMAGPPAAGEDVPMAGDRPLLPSPMLHPDDAVPASASPRLMRAEFDALVTELHELRSRYQHELADRLRDARASGSPGDNEDVLAVHEEVSVTAARIARSSRAARARRTPRRARTRATNPRRQAQQPRRADGSARRRC
jgi:hypothetical protein